MTPESLKQPVESSLTREKHPGPIPVEMNPVLRTVRDGDKSIKIFYALMRELRGKGSPVIDIGSTVEVDIDHQEQIHNLTDKAHEASKMSGDYISYPSSWGLLEYREAIANFMQNRAGIDIDPISETMVTGGIISAVERVIQALNITHVAMPDLAPYFVRSLATLHHKKILEVPLDLKTGNLKLESLNSQIQEAKIEPNQVLLYIGIPSAPVGTIPQDNFIPELISFGQNNHLPIISDFYSVATTYSNRPLRPLMSYAGAKTVAVEAISPSKELHLPGIRTGGIVGHPGIIEAMRLYAASALDMIPAANQRLAANAFQSIPPASVARRLSRELHQEILPAFEAMNWPVIIPEAGLDMLVRIPPAFEGVPVEDHSLLATIHLITEYGVAFSPASVFGPRGDQWLRIVLKQQSGKIPRALHQLKEKGFHWQTVSPTQQSLARMDQITQMADLTNL